MTPLLIALFGILLILGCFALGYAGKRIHVGLMRSLMVIGSCLIWGGAIIFILP